MTGTTDQGATPTRSSTAGEEEGEEAVGRRIGVLTYVLCYDDLSRGDSARLPTLGGEALEIEIGRAAGGEGTHVAGKGFWIRDIHVSRRHAEVRRGTVDVLRDLGSKHGTWVNGRRIAEHELCEGDLIEVGRSLLLYRSVDAGTARLLAEGGAAVLGTRTLSPAMVRVVDEIERTARTKFPVLVVGETGTGKEVVAREIHRRSGRRGEMVSINCGALSESLVEDELFGHVKGAHSHAGSARAGLLRSANGGTVLLDEIGDMPEAAQVKLLRVIENGEVKPVGADGSERVDIRWIAATNAQVSGPGARLRSDLLGRLGGVLVKLPPLRERREDLGILAAHILGRCAEELERAVPTAIERRAGRVLFSGRLSLNVRGLQDTLKRAAAVARGERIELSDLGMLAEEGVEEEDEERRGEAVGVGRPEPVARAGRQSRPERAALESALGRSGGVIESAARALGTSERQLRRWMAHYRIEPRRPEG